jgi:hypothetical protein
MADAATEQRPDDLADVASGAPADAPAPEAAARPGDDLGDYLEEYQTATARPTTPPTDQSSPATQATGDAIDQLLAELSQPTGPGQSPLFTHGADVHQQAQAQEQLQGRLDVLQSENAQLKQFVQHQRDVRDFNRLTASVQSKLPGHLPGDFAETQLLAAAINNPDLQQAFDFRSVDRRAAEVEMRKVEVELQRLSRDPAADPQQIANLQQYGYRVGLALNSREILRRAIRDVERRGLAHTVIDETATADHDAVAAAVRGASGKAQPEPPPNFGNMSDAELRKYTKENFGF